MLNIYIYALYIPNIQFIIFKIHLPLFSLPFHRFQPQISFAIFPIRTAALQYKTLVHTLTHTHVAVVVLAGFKHV